jgi:hypothetical protein
MNQPVTHHQFGGSSKSKSGALSRLRNENADCLSGIANWGGSTASYFEIISEFLTHTRIDDCNMIIFIYNIDYKFSL